MFSLAAALEIALVGLTLHILVRWPNACARDCRPRDRSDPARPPARAIETVPRRHRPAPPAPIALAGLTGACRGCLPRRRRLARSRSDRGAAVTRHPVDHGGRGLRGARRSPARAAGDLRQPAGPRLGRRRPRWCAASAPNFCGPFRSRICSCSWPNPCALRSRWSRSRSGPDRVGCSIGLPIPTEALAWLPLSAPGGDGCRPGRGLRARLDRRLAPAAPRGPRRHRRAHRADLTCGRALRPPRRRAGGRGPAVRRRVEHMLADLAHVR